LFQLISEGAVAQNVKQNAKRFIRAALQEITRDRAQRYFMGHHMRMIWKGQNMNGRSPGASRSFAVAPVWGCALFVRDGSAIFAGDRRFAAAGL